MVFKPTSVKILIYYDYNMYNLTILSFCYGPINLNFFLINISFTSKNIFKNSTSFYFQDQVFQHYIIVILIIVQNRIFTFNTLKKIHGYL
jgi:hypothetical protein